MKTTIIYIHGGTAFSSYDLFLTHLKTKEIADPYGLKPKKHWKEDIHTVFGSTCKTIFPRMPNGQNAHYEEWKIWFERHIPFIVGNVILIGNSQGGYFLAKYLSENTPSFPIVSLYLVSAPIQKDDFGIEDGGDFSFPLDKIDNISIYVNNITLIHSKDDTVVPFSHFEMYKAYLPNAKTMVFKNRCHFVGESFPEIIEDIKKYI